MKSKVSSELLLFSQIHREQLEQKYKPIIKERLEYRNLVSYVGNKNEPIFGWFRYKEGFSKRLVDDLLLNEWKLPKGTLVFDPFAGCGTTLLACQQLVYPALGVDIMPLAVFVTKAKLYQGYNVALIEEAAHRLLSKPSVSTGRLLPGVRIIPLAFTPETQAQVLFYREEIQAIQDPAIRDFLMLALLASLEEASSTAKDGQFLRLVTRAPKPLEVVLEAKLARMISDLRLRSFPNGEYNPSGPSVAMYLSDARALSKEVLAYQGRVGAIVTSPPYLNRYDYSRTYALELCVLFDEHGEPCVKDFQDLKNIRHSLLRSHIESLPPQTSLVRVKALEEILLNLEPKQLNNPRIPIMIEGYFEDMNLAISQMAKMLKPGGLVALVVANARFEGELVPVDLILSELAANHGLTTKEIRVTRYKGNSSQQMGRYGRLPVRESIVFWEKAITK